VIFIPAYLAEDAVAHAEFINLEDAFNFELNRSGKNGGEFEGGWTPKKYQALVAWIKRQPIQAQDEPGGVRHDPGRAQGPPAGSRIRRPEIASPGPDKR